MIRWLDNLIVLLLGVVLVGCDSANGPSIEGFTRELYTPTYASGFSILGYNPDGATEDGEPCESPYKSTLIKVRNPWQGVEGEERSLLILRNGEPLPKGYRGPVVQGDAERIVCLSSSHIAMLDAIGGVERIVGVSGLDFVQNPSIRARSGEVGDVGYDNNFNYELLVALDADLVLLYGIFSPSIMEPKLKELGIPYLYVGEYVEQSPLGKAEWMVAVGECAGLRPEAERHFATIPPQYNHWKGLAAATKHRPKVMLNLPYGDAWFMPWPSSYTARLIADAGGDYLYQKAETTTGSATIDLEQATVMISEADLWLDLNELNDRESLVKRYPRFADLGCVKRGELYNNNRRANPNGGNDLWESGVVTPHLILCDLVKIFHPELVDQELYYYQKLK